MYLIYQFLYCKRKLKKSSKISFSFFFLFMKSFAFRSEQLIFFHAENRLLYNYLIWYEKKILPNQTQEKRDSISIPRSSKPHTNNLPSTSKLNLDCSDALPRQISKPKIKQPLSLEKKREIAEASFKVLLAYSQKYGINITHYVDECIVINQTNLHDIKIFSKFRIQ